MLLNGTTLVYYRAYALSAKSNDKQEVRIVVIRGSHNDLR